MAFEEVKAALLKVPVFADLDCDQIDWFASHTEERHLNAGDLLVQAGEPADRMFVILEGELRLRPENGEADTAMFLMSHGEVSGLLPYSRMTHFKMQIRATRPSWVMTLHKDLFDEMLQRIPQLLPRLVQLLADRVRDFSVFSTQREKLTALGKLSAGLAHELNNPASSARRAAESLRDAVRNLRRVSVRLDGHALDADQRRALAELEDRSLARIPTLPPLDPIDQMDFEDAVSDWLRRRGIEDDAQLSAALVDYGFRPDELDAFARVFPAAVPPRVLHDVLHRLAAVSSVERLLHEIEGTTMRISELVRSIKEYSYMDRQPEKEVDVHDGIESTLTMLKFRLKKGVTVIREYDRTIPKVCVHASELNQVWTNIIDNAIDAMKGQGQLRIRTVRELDCVLVEIQDNGPGIPPDIQTRIFDPFFTTKPMGEGTGLGLDTVFRLIRKHRGDISVESQPGDTRFQVRLPFRPPSAT